MHPDARRLCYERSISSSIIQTPEVAKEPVGPLALSIDWRPRDGVIRSLMLRLMNEPMPKNSESGNVLVTGAALLFVLLVAVGNGPRISGGVRFKRLQKYRPLGVFPSKLF